MGFLGIKKRKIEYNNALDAKRLGRSFKAAFDGIYSTYKKEQNIKIHTVIAILVIIAGFIFKINYIEWLVCLVLIGFMLMAEFFNTAIEYVVDLASPDIHPLAKAAKDTTVGELTLKHIEKFENEIKEAGIETSAVSPKLLPNYTKQANI